MGNVNNKRNWSFCMRWLLAILGILGVIAILTIPTFYYYLKFHNSFMLRNFLAKLSDDPAIWGTFGDYLGGTLNPIISFLAFIGLLYTIRQQAQEMKATRDELERTAEQQSRQSEIFNLQQFESTFFSLLEQYNKIVETLVKNVDEINKYNRTHNSIDSFINEIYEKYSEIYQSNVCNNQIKINFYIANNIQQNLELKRYFIVLFQILKLISLNLSNDTYGNTNNKISIEDYLSDDEKSREKIGNLYINPQEKIYSNILRSFIPNEILKLIALNCLSINSKTFNNFQGLLNRYNFLEHLQLGMEDTILPVKHHDDFIWLYLTTIGIDNITPSFGNNKLPTKMVELFNESKSRFISILNDQSNKLKRRIETLKGQPNMNTNKKVRDIESELEKTIKILETLQNM
ncbi:hypothetical protein CYK00_07505 [Neisseria sicca]|uniref:Phage abortive infection protein n=1 Tax=Neisseria sicca TaxID=490 RepID=A0A2I1XBL8_NEISI|nr:putative phage abortive infection protein [Neisseria sicca]PLA40034.1 hypothetical protein CYK00_07505 [Neisseria sicca]